jgi:hypothetical protein
MPRSTPLANPPADMILKILSLSISSLFSVFVLALELTLQASDWYYLGLVDSRGASSFLQISL